MEEKDEIEYFKILEEKVGTLIEQIRSLREEKGLLEEKIQGRERDIAGLSLELENLRESRNSARERIVSILDRIEKSGT